MDITTPCGQYSLKGTTQIEFDENENKDKDHVLEGGENNTRIMAPTLTVHQPWPTLSSTMHRLHSNTTAYFCSMN